MFDSLVSIIIPVYNVEKYIVECINSVLNQSYSNIEVILINDGSTDNSLSICKDFESKDCRVVVLNKENGGLSSARNAGLDKAKGEYILFVDSDDTIDRQLLEFDVGLLSEQVDIVFHSIKYFGEKTGFLKTFDDGIYPSQVLLNDMLLDVIGSQVVRGLYKKKLWDNVRFPIGRMYEDLPTTYKAVAKSNQVLFASKYAYNYRINNSSISKTFNPEKSFHIFLGFKERCEYCGIHSVDLLEKCIIKTSIYAISTYYYHLMYKKNKSIFVAKSFLKDNKRIILSKRNKNKGRKVLIWMYFYCFPLFYIVCLFIRIFGLKK